jgi:hypothetical protein
MSSTTPSNPPASPPSALASVKDGALAGNTLKISVPGEAIALVNNENLDVRDNKVIQPETKVRRSASRNGRSQPEVWGRSASRHHPRSSRGRSVSCLGPRCGRSRRARHRSSSRNRADSHPNNARLLWRCVSPPDHLVSPPSTHWLSGSAGHFLQGLARTWNREGVRFRG